MTYDQWLDHEVEHLRHTLAGLARSGHMDVKLWFVPATEHGYATILARADKPARASQVLWLPGAGSLTTNVMSTAMSHLRAHLWHVCRDLPVFPAQPAYNPN